MIGDISKAEAIYIACGYTDMRRNIDGLAAYVKQAFGLDPVSNTVFFFCGRKCDRLKALYYEGDGFVLKCPHWHLSTKLSISQANILTIVRLLLQKTNIEPSNRSAPNTP